MRYGAQMAERKARRLVDLAGVAEYLHDNQRHIKNLIQKRQIPFVRLGRSLRFDLDEIDAWLDANSVKARKA